ncbi:MAG: 16S rRNA (cytidine(1402)-2'-O)-methyltransferase, partial [Nitrospiraceae bacterium]
MKRGANPGTLYVVSTPIGNSDDVTLRALRVLGDVAVIAAEDPQRTQALCERHRIHTPLMSYHNENKEEKTALLLALLGEGQNVALVSDEGTPVIADPGSYLISEAVRSNIRVTSLPGPCAALAAVTVSGLPGDRVLFLGAVPRTPATMHRLLLTLRHEPGTLVWFTPANRLCKTIQAVRDLLGDRYLAVAGNLTTSEEICVRGLAEDVLRQLHRTPINGAVTLAIEGCRKKSQSKQKVK